MVHMGGLMGFDVEGPRKDDVRHYPTYATRPSHVKVIPFQKGGTLQLFFSIRNVGDRPVRVTAFDAGPDADRYVTVLDPAGIGYRPRCCLTNNLRDFQPFAIGPSDEYVVGFNYRFVCQRFLEPGSSQIRDSIRLRLDSERWITRTLPYRLVVQAPERGDCSPAESAYLEAA